LPAKSVCIVLRQLVIVALFGHAFDQGPTRAWLRANVDEVPGTSGAQLNRRGELPATISARRMARPRARKLPPPPACRAFAWCRRSARVTFILFAVDDRAINSATDAVCVLLAHALETEVRIRPIRDNEPKILIPNLSLAQRVVPDQAQLDLQPHAYEPHG